MSSDGQKRKLAFKRGKSHTIHQVETPPRSVLNALVNGVIHQDGPQSNEKKVQDEIPLPKVSSIHRIHSHKILPMRQDGHCHPTILSTP